MANTRERPNLVVIMADGWRRQAVGCMEQDPVETPHLDAFARQGTLCTQAISNHPMCTPARAAFLTGRYAMAIGMEYNWQRLPVDEPCWSTVAAEHGYDTALIGKWHLDDHEPDDDYGNMWNAFTPPGPRRMGFRYWYSSGCCHAHWQLRYTDTAGRLHEDHGWQPDHETDRAVAYLRNRGDERPSEKPFALWLNFSPPHNECSDLKDHDFPGPQYFAPNEFEDRYRQRSPLPNANPDTDERGYQRWAPAYFGMVTSLDECIGRLMRCLEEEGLAEDTIVVITGDHGEMLGTHGRWIKDIYYEESIGVPFLIRFPGVIPADVRNDSLFGLVDAMPTLLGLMRLPVPDGRDGRNCAESLRTGKRAPERAQLISHNTGAPPPHRTRYDFPIEQGMYWRGLRTRRYTYACVDQRPQSVFYGDAPWHLRGDATQVLFDNVSDPHQMHPIFPGDGSDAVIAELHHHLAERLAAIGDDFLDHFWAPTRPGKAG